MFLRFWVETKISTQFIKYYTLLLLVFYTLIVAAEINIYAEWQTKIDYKAIAFLKNPTEVIETATHSQTLFFIVYLILFVVFLYWFYVRYIATYLDKINNQFKRKIIVAFSYFIIGSSLLIVGLRGGLQPIPINQSWAYFSNNNTVNLVSVNDGWNVLGSLYQNSNYLDQNPYIEMPMDEAKKRVNNLYEVEKDTTIYFINNQQPNIVLLILESFTADIIKSCGGDSGITPQFEKLISEGYLFDSIYSSGTLSHQGMASLFSGFPAQTVTSIIKEQSKYSKLPSLNKKLAKRGYNTSFYFGGQLTYANIKSYMYFNQFDKIKDMYDYDDTIPRGHLGIHDQYTLQDHLLELNKKPQPFFSSLFTVSTHSPYDVPMKWKINKGGNEQDFLNAAWYSDSCIGSYINECKKQAWYKNTLFIVVADHGKHSHYNRNFFSPELRHIPLLFFGEVLKPEFKGKKNHLIGSHHDLAATLLSQLKITHDNFNWSKNLMNPYSKPFAFYSSPTWIGFCTPKGFCSYDYRLKDFNLKIVPNERDTPELANNGKAYLQVLFQQYLDY
jgi:phosphoglycerol transferase MdoB-like AlkP superfamily enzyme